MGAESLSHEMQIQKDEAQSLINHFFALFPSFLQIFKVKKIFRNSKLD